MRTIRTVIYTWTFSVGFFLAETFVPFDILKNSFHDLYVRIASEARWTKFGGLRFDISPGLVKILVVKVHNWAEFHC